MDAGQAVHADMDKWMEVICNTNNLANNYVPTYLHTKTLYVCKHINDTKKNNA